MCARFLPRLVGIDEQEARVLDGGLHGEVASDDERPLDDGAGEEVVARCDAGTWRELEACVSRACSVQRSRVSCALTSVGRSSHGRERCGKPRIDSTRRLQHGVSYGELRCCRGNLRSR